MKRWKSLGLIVFSAFLFVGSIGMGVFHHSCRDDGSTTSFYFNRADSCEHNEITKSCCSAEKTQEESVEDDCCDDKVSVYKVKLDFSHEYFVVPFITIPTQLDSFELYEAIILQKPSLQPVTRPPPKIGMQLLVENQTFLI
ncbi:MAG: hypothetical protein MK066_11685 [Crocinitomicaceae bacterium]|nr:hypothetical protein [Crocinitomicaceae bacterium]